MEKSRKKIIKKRHMEKRIKVMKREENNEEGEEKKRINYNLLYQAKDLES